MEPKRLLENNTTSLTDSMTFQSDSNQSVFLTYWVSEQESKSSIFEDPYASIWMKFGTTASSIVQIIESFVLIGFVAYETQGAAGPYRTVISQLLSRLYAMVGFCNKYT